MSSATMKRTASVETTEAPSQDRLKLSSEVELLSQVLDATAATYAAAINDPALGRLQKAMMTAAAIDNLKRSITPAFMKHVMSLMNSPLGFKTDLPSKKNPRPYAESEIKEVLVAALLSGVYPFDNEFNIIAGNLYIAQKGYARLVREIPGLTDLKLAPGIPFEHNGRTCIRFGATWRFNGVSQSLTDAENKPGRVFALITNEYMSADALVGKAIRKGLKAIYEQVTGSIASGAADDSEIVEGEVSPAMANKGDKPSELRGKLQQMAAATAGPSMSDMSATTVDAPPNGNPSTGEMDYTDLLRDIDAAETPEELDRCELRLRKLSEAVELTPEQHDAAISQALARRRVLRGH